jgi:hypothetical protein
MAAYFEGLIARSTNRGQLRHCTYDRLRKQSVSDVAVLEHFLPGNSSRLKAKQCVLISSEGAPKLADLGIAKLKRWLEPGLNRVIVLQIGMPGHVAGHFAAIIR